MCPVYVLSTFPVHSVVPSPSLRRYSIRSLVSSFVRSLVFSGTFAHTFFRTSPRLPYGFSHTFPPTFHCAFLFIFLRVFPTHSLVRSPYNTTQPLELSKERKRNCIYIPSTTEAGIRKCFLGPVFKERCQCPGKGST